MRQQAGRESLSHLGDLRGWRSVGPGEPGQAKTVGVLLRRSSQLLDRSGEGYPGISRRGQSYNLHVAAPIACMVSLAHSPGTMRRSTAFVLIAPANAKSMSFTLSPFFNLTSALLQTIAAITQQTHTGLRNVFYRTDPVHAP